MICDECHGTGFVSGLYGYNCAGDVRPGPDRICLACCGSGIVHCCEGEQAQPDFMIIDIAAEVDPRRYRSVFGIAHLLSMIAADPAQLLFDAFPMMYVSEDAALLTPDNSDWEIDATADGGYTLFKTGD